MRNSVAKIALLEGGMLNEPELPDEPDEKPQDLPPSDGDAGPDDWPPGDGDDEPDDSEPVEREL